MIEPAQIVPKEQPVYCTDVMESKMKANPSYGEKIRSGILAPLELVFLLQLSVSAFAAMIIDRPSSSGQMALCDTIARRFP